jgi:PII-like signaling protein
MSGTLLRFYVHENRLHRHVALYEWLLEQAKKQGVRGGSAFRAIAGFGRHGILHEEHFFELAAQMTVVVEFLVTADEAERLIALVRAEGIGIFYARVAAEFGTTEAVRPASA